MNGFVVDWLCHYSSRTSHIHVYEQRIIWPAEMFLYLVVHCWFTESIMLSKSVSEGWLISLVQLCLWCLSVRQPTLSPYYIVWSYLSALRFNLVESTDRPRVVYTQEEYKCSCFQSELGGKIPPLPSSLIPLDRMYGKETNIRNIRNEKIKRHLKSFLMIWFAGKFINSTN